jgi:hypothetical protein
MEMCFLDKQAMCNAAKIWPLRVISTIRLANLEY